MKKQLIQLSFILLSSLIGFSQKVFINGIEGDRPLIWDDYKGKPDRGSEFFAYTYSEFKGKVNSYRIKGDTAFLDVEYSIELSKNSWVKKDKMSDTLLDHEQGHFNIGKIMILELNAVLKSTTFFKNTAQDKMNSIYKDMAEKESKMEKQYDEETKHGNNREKQLQWNKFIKDKLAELKADVK